MNIGLVTLGCTKNQVDSEMILGLFKNKGFNIISNPEEADVIIVNTCGFIESAKKEAIETILEMADYKINGKCKHLIVTGCLAKRYKKDIIKNMKEVDLVIGVDEYENIDKILNDYFKKDYKKCSLKYNDRILASNFPMAYIRIADGCDNKCSYCAIPIIRGKFVSRKMEDILSEVSLLASEGIEEFNIIAQDTTKYGLDIYGKLSLDELLHKITLIDGVKLVRVLYMYSFEITDSLLNEMKNNSKIAPYFDIPIQHTVNRLLKSMNRYDTKEIIFDRVKKIRETIPNAILRTTVIVGFPGETEEDFRELLEDIKRLSFDRLGAFTYSREEDTLSYSMSDMVDDNTKNRRLEELLKLQRKISLERNRKRVGKVVEALIENISDDEKYFVARSYMDAPDVDGKIYIKITKETALKCVIGEFSLLKITDYSEYDLFAEIIEK